MNRFVISHSVLMVFSLMFTVPGYAYDLSDNVQIHGFFTQNALYSSDNQIYGNSKHRISYKLTEAGLNLRYQPLEWLSVSSQGLYRQAGELDSGSVNLDYGLVDLALLQNSLGGFGIRLGRIKNPLGLYNETRDVAFTTPTIILPQGIYYDRSRSLFLSSDGGQFYCNYRMGTGNLSAKLNFGKIRNDNDEIRDAVLPLGAKGDMDTDTDFTGQIIYEINSGEYLAAISYADVKLSYDPGSGDYYANGTARFYPMIFSAQYNGERVSLTGEYLYQRNKFVNFGPLSPDASDPSESWYIQIAYRFNRHWQILGRYCEHYLNKYDRNGHNFTLAGLPEHMGFTKDLTLSLRWDINPWMMVRGEYHRINGTSGITMADNPDRATTGQHYDLCALQLAFKF